MVKNRPMLTNSCMNLRYMLGTSNTLNTSNNNDFSKKVKDITMSNQQVTEKKILSNLTHIWNSLNILSNLRDFIRRTPARGLRYSPLYLNNIISTKLNIINVYKVLKRKLSINHLASASSFQWYEDWVKKKEIFHISFF
jgi:hypothetical protein